MQRKLSRLYLAEAVREILLSVPEWGRDAFTRAECEQRVCEEYGDFNPDQFAGIWTEARRYMGLAIERL